MATKYCTDSSNFSLSQEYIYDGDIWTPTGSISPSSPPSSIWYNDGTYSGYISLLSVSNWNTNTPDDYSPYIGKRATGYGTGTAYYGDYLTADEPTPVTTSGQIEIMSVGATTVVVRITRLEFGSGYSELTIKVNGQIKSVTPLVNTGQYWYTDSVDFQGLTPLTNYTVSATISYPGQATSYPTTSIKTTEPIDRPPVVIIKKVEGQNQIKVTWSATDDVGMRTNNTYECWITGADNSNFVMKGYVTNTAQNTDITYSFATDGTGLDFVVGKTYQVKVVGYDTKNQSDSSLGSAVYSKSRPTNFAWISPKTSGEDFNLLATEWNALMEKVNDFRLYKGVPRSSYTTAVKDTDFYYYIFNEAVHAIERLNANVPFTVFTGDIVYASDLNRLRDAINEVT